MSNISIIIGREFNERVRKKSFIITTLLMPVLMLVLMAAPALIMNFSKGELKRIAVIDESGLVAPALESNEEIAYEPTSLTTDEARRELTDFFGVLYIGSDILQNSSNVRLYANSSTSLSIESDITGQIERILEAEKLKNYHIDNLQQILDEVKTTVTLQTFRNDKSQEEDAQSQSSAVATATGYILGFVLYMFLLIYGSMVMQSVIEEKNNRVLEVIVSSVRPFELMMGKILGVAAVAVVQVLIWGVLIVVAGSVVMPQLMPADAMASVQAMQQGMPDAAMGGMDSDMLQIVAALTDLGYIVKIFVCLLLFIVGGYLLYSAMFAAVGSAVDNVQDASQLQMPVTLPIILALLMMIAVIKDPNSPLAFWFSLIPFTSPVVMMARIPYGIPAWEVALSLVLLYASFVAMVWLAGKIYRVGIFMYGKKPTFRELLKWMKYKY
ncbi:ABC transporter permease [uncultured Alistipes sp.]|jgi:ABC-2 type transport system permease protein|uniref:ABC transporter permease n=1 Tax=uncultured Alistipes sp. TaxID=538949 RepID=UPI0025E3CEB1|nr:ABC transporter permease [uncultured Alistipes sp.]